jgi:hypothetical protein
LRRIAQVSHLIKTHAAGARQGGGKFFAEKFW